MTKRIIITKNVGMKKLLKQKWLRILKQFAQGSFCFKRLAMGASKTVLDTPSPKPYFTCILKSQRLQAGPKMLFHVCGQFIRTCLSDRMTNIKMEKSAVQRRRGYVPKKNKSGKFIESPTNKDELLFIMMSSMFFTFQTFKIDSFRTI